MSRLVLIGGPPGVGKSRVARELLARTDDCAWLDGDDLWRTHPFRVDAGRKRMVERNIAFVLRGFLQEGIGTVLCSWVLHREDLVRRLLEPLGDLSFELRWFTLLCSEPVLRERRASDPERDPSDPRAFERLQQCRALTGTTPIDTDGHSASEIADRLQAALRDGA